MSNHAALIADVRGSRHLDNWPEVFQAITRTLDDANKRFQDDLVVKFHPTVGDEFQGVLTRPEVAFEAYTFIKASLPVKLCFGLGVGEVEKSGLSDTGLRGSAFYRARTALEECKEEKGLLRVNFTDGKSRTDRIINTLLLVTEAIEKYWTARQGEVANFCRLNPDLTHKVLGEFFRTTRPAITQILKAARWEEVKRAEELIHELSKNA